MRNHLILKTDSECDLTFKYPHLMKGKTGDDFSDIPLICYANGSICWEATDYLLDLYDTKPNIAKSTLGTYARHLSRIIQYIEYTRLSFSDLLDSSLLGHSGLVTFLQTPKHSKNGRAADNNQVNKILNRLFSLLFYLQNKGHTTSTKIISDNPKIRAQINVTISKHRPRGTNREVSYYSHPARLESKSPGKRRPIQDDAIDTLIEAIYDFTDNEFIHQRWCCLLSVMEFTGARESEIAKITIHSVIKAKKLIDSGETAKLEIVTTKGKNKTKKRVIPIPDTVIEEIYNYILFHRNPLVSEAKNKGIISNDHGRLLTTDDGRPLSEKRIYDHFKEVRDSTYLKSTDASPHLFRHRFITKQVRNRLKIFLDEKNYYTADIESFVIKKVKLLSGHVSDSALWGYVDNAMEELNTFKEVEERVYSKSTSEAKKRKVTKMLSEARSHKSPKVKAKALDQLLEKMLMADGFKLD
ncbi:tyrosine-type recombinase/integrase [Agaribacterium sp. ZY112]|uniref:tyrosine-type recombinase/integrase n=1 Tax=Agaribacterium sp. ZY112 TaxID=3233574 RepID=UPI00352489EB